MKYTRISKILTVLFAVVLCFGPVGLAAEPVGTAFTYQGRLIDANNAADGLYDFQFKLFDANNAGNKLGVDVNKPEVDVIDGYFTAELDFGNVFDGNNRWLEIGVRPGDQNDPCVYSVLSPRQKLTPTPYALYAKTAGGGGADSDWIILGNNMYSGVSGNVGIGTSSPSAKLEVAGQIESSVDGFKFPDGSVQTTAMLDTNNVYFSVKRDASYTWLDTGSERVIDFSSGSSILENEGSAYNTSLNQFTAPADGIYSFSGRVDFRNLNVGSLTYCKIIAGGRSYYGDWSYYASGGVQVVNVNITVHLVSGQIAALYGYVASNPPASVFGNTPTNYLFTYFSGARVK